MNKNVTEQDLIELFGLQMTNYFRNTCHVELILCSKTNNSRVFAFVTGPEHVLVSQTKRNRVSGENFSYRRIKKEVIDTSINTIKGNFSRCQSKISKTNCFQQNTGCTWT